ncbi:hypothetical protein Gasu2_43660 [Galdieria sulphuraria]|nr:hypothetical protein Gasu2_43660 [Galdieria sulphuraria]
MPTKNICFSLQEYGERYVELIKYARELGLEVLSRSCLVYPKDTILLADLPLRKTVKVVSAVASGLVILPVRFLLECRDAGKILKVEGFAWQEQELSASSTQLLLEASRYWRKCKYGPLQDVLVFIVGGSKPEVKNHKAIVEAAQVLILGKEGIEYSQWKALCIEQCLACCSSFLLFELIIMRRLRNSQRYIPFSECASNTVDILGRHLPKRENSTQRREGSIMIPSDANSDKDSQIQQNLSDKKHFKRMSRQDNEWSSVQEVPGESNNAAFQSEPHSDLSQSTVISLGRGSNKNFTDTTEISLSHASGQMEHEDHPSHHGSLNSACSVSSYSSSNIGAQSSSNFDFDETDTLDTEWPIIDGLKNSIQNTRTDLCIYNVLRIALRSIVRNHQSSNRQLGSEKCHSSPFISLFEMASTSFIREDTNWNIPLASRKIDTELKDKIGIRGRPEKRFSEIRRHRLQKIAKQWTKEKVQSWSAAQITAWLNRHVNANAYYYRHTDPGDGITQSLGKWDEEEQQLFFAEYERWKRNGWRIGSCWGIFSLAIPRRVGYQCSNFYRDCIREGTLEDPTYAISVEDGGVLKRLHPELEDKNLVPPPEELNHLSDRWEWPEVKEMERQVDLWLQEIHPKVGHQMREIDRIRKGSTITNRNISSVLRHRTVGKKRIRESEDTRGNVELVESPINLSRSGNVLTDYSRRTFTKVVGSSKNSLKRRFSSSSSAARSSRERCVHGGFSENKDVVTQFQEHVSHLLLKSVSNARELELHSSSYHAHAGRKIENIVNKLKTGLPVKDSRQINYSMELGGQSFFDYEKPQKAGSCGRKGTARRLGNIDSISNDQSTGIQPLSFSDCISITRHNLAQLEPYMSLRDGSNNAGLCYKAEIKGLVFDGVSSQSDRNFYSIRKLSFPSLSKLLPLIIKYSEFYKSYTAQYKLGDINLPDIIESGPENFIEAIVSAIQNYFCQEVYSCEKVARFLKGCLELWTLKKTEWVSLQKFASSDSIPLEFAFPSLSVISQTQRNFLFDCYFFVLELVLQGACSFSFCHVIFMDLVKFLSRVPEYLYQSEDGESFWSKFNTFVETFVVNDVDWLPSYSLEDKIDYCLFLVTHFSFVYLFKTDSEVIDFSSVTNLPTEAMPSNWELVLELLKKSTCFKVDDISFPERSHFALYVCAYLSLYWCPDDSFLEWLLTNMNSHLKYSLETGKQLPSCCFDLPSFFKETLYRFTEGPPFVAFPCYSKCYVCFWFIRAKSVWLYQTSSAVQKQFCSQMFLVIEETAVYRTTEISVEFLEYFQCIYRHLSGLILALTGICDDSMRLNAFRKLWRPLLESLSFDRKFYFIFSLFLDICKFLFSSLVNPGEYAPRLVEELWLFLSKLMKEYKDCFLIISEKSSKLKSDTASALNGMKKDMLRKHMSSLEHLVHKIFMAYSEWSLIESTLCRKILCCLVHPDTFLFEAHPLFLGISSSYESSSKIDATSEEAIWDTLVLSVNEEAFMLAKEYGMKLYTRLTPLFVAIMSRFLTFFCLQKSQNASESSSFSATLPVPTFEDCNYIVRLSADLFCLLSRLGSLSWKEITRVTIDCNINENVNFASRDSLWTCIIYHQRFQILFWRQILESSVHEFLPPALYEEFDFCVIITWLSSLCGWESYASNVLKRESCIEDMKFGELIIQRFPRLSTFIQPTESENNSLNSIGKHPSFGQVDAQRGSLFAWTCHQLEDEWHNCKLGWSREYLSLVPYVMRRVIQSNVNSILNHPSDQQRPLRASYLGFTKTWKFTISSYSEYSPVYGSFFIILRKQQSQRKVDSDIQRLLVGIIRTCLSQLNSSFPIVEGLVMYPSASSTEGSVDIRETWDRWYFCSSCGTSSGTLERTRKLRLWCVPILNSFLRASEKHETISTTIQSLRSVSYRLVKFGCSSVESYTWLKSLIPCLHSTWKLLCQSYCEMHVRSEIYKLLDRLLLFPLSGMPDLFELYLSFYQLVGYYVLKESAQNVGLSAFRKALKKKIDLAYNYSWKPLVKDFVSVSEPSAFNVREDYTVLNAHIAEDSSYVANHNHQNSFYEWNTLDDLYLGWYVVRHCIQRYPKHPVATEWIELLSCLVDHFDERRANMIRKEILKFSFQKPWKPCCIG